MRQLSQTPKPSSRSILRRAVKWSLFGLASLSVVVALLYAEENRRSKKAWENCRRRLASRGVDLDWRRMAPPPVADAENFATTPFFAALFDYLPGTYTPRDLQAYNRVAGFAQTEAPYAEQRGAGDPVPPMAQGQRTDLAQALGLVHKAKQHAGAGTRSQPEQIQRARSELAAGLLDALEQYRPVLDELRVASGRPQARFNLSYSEDYAWRVSQPHLPVLKRISRVLAWRGSAELALQNSSAAAEDVALMIYLAGALRDEPFPSSFAARNVILFNARQIIWEGLADHRWSEGQLRDFQSRLQPFTLSDAQRYLCSERAAGNGVFEFVHKDPSVVKSWRLGPTFPDKLRTYVFQHMPGGWMYLEQISYHRAFDDLVAPGLDLAAGCIRPGLIERACHPTFPILGHELVVAPVMRGARFLLLTAALAQNGVNQTVLACALERHRLATGTFPESLDAVGPQLLGATPGDVITGKPMKYRLSPDDQFQLYSVGWNEQDEGGKVILDKQTKVPDATQGDWIWPAYQVD
ncbi:MAG TPA: hypothetical protein VN578_24615 [Candidatus Binatia bacterium]|jgi:hypothetical protein|nr:hypothetical protein [Candidatus Binatia bacterium]